MSHSALRLRRALPTLAAVCHSLSPFPLLNPSISSPLSLQSTSFFLSSIVQSRLFTSYYKKVSLSSFSKLSAQFKGMDYNHWVIYFDMDFIDEQDESTLTDEETVKFYEETCADILQISLKEVRQRIYACTTASLQAVMTEKETKKFPSFYRVGLVVPDFYIDPEREDYGGDKYTKGRIITRNSSDFDLLKKLSSTVDFLKKLKDETGDKNYIEYLWDKFFYHFTYHLVGVGASNPQLSSTEESQIVQIGLDLLQVYKDECGCFAKGRCLDYLLYTCANANDLKSFILIWEEIDNAGLSHDFTNYSKLRQIFLSYEDRPSAIKMLREIPKKDPRIEMIIERYKSNNSYPPDNDDPLEFIKEIEGIKL